MNKINTKNIYQYKYLSLMLNETANQDFDWIKKSKYFKRFVYPPKILENTTLFEDGLKEIIPLKLNETLTRRKQLEEEKNQRIGLILKDISKKNQFFYKELAISYFSEYFIVYLWMYYWLNLWEKITKAEVKIIKSYSNKVTDIEIQKAKEYPIENLYEGKLKMSGNRFIGLCPFHQEKTPSFFIFPNNHWYCFGACSEGGDAINFAMKLNGSNFIEAIRRLNGYY